MAKEEALKDGRSNKSLLVDYGGESKRLTANTSGELLVEVSSDSSIPTTMGDGAKAVTTAGTQVVLASSTACKRVYITGKAANTNKIYIGGSSISSSTGTFIYASQTIIIDTSNLANIWIDADTNGEGVQFTYVA